MSTRDDLSAALAAGTPGPWIHDGNTVYALIADGRHNVNRFSARVQSGGVYGAGGGELSANARAIALAVNLAPELLASEAALRAERDAAVLRAEKADERLEMRDADHAVYVRQLRMEAEALHRELTRVLDPMVRAKMMEPPPPLVLTGDAAETHRLTKEADALRASLAAVTAERDAARAEYETTANALDKATDEDGLSKHEHFARRALKAEAERDHLQARCEAEGAARKRLEERSDVLEAALRSIALGQHADSCLDAGEVPADECACKPSPGDQAQAALETKP